MNLAVLSENQEIGEKGRRVTFCMMKSMEGVKNLDSNTDESLGIWRAVCIESKLWNLGDPNRYRKVKRKHISQKVKLWTIGRESEGSIVSMICRTT